VKRKLKKKPSIETADPKNLKFGSEALRLGLVGPSLGLFFTLFSRENASLNFISKANVHKESYIRIFLDEYCEQQCLNINYDL
jgi:hypothetical protein